MQEIRIHGRGGQGIVKASQIIVQAAVAQGKFANAIPYFGFERQGAPVAAFVRIDSRPIRPKTQVYQPDCIIVMDDSVMKAVDVFAGLKTGGVVVINTKVAPAEIRVPPTVGSVAVVDATGLALSILGVNRPNTAVLGAFAAATGWVDLEEIGLEVEKVFGRKNVEALRAGFDAVVKFQPSLTQQISSPKLPTSIRFDFIVPVGTELYVVNTGDWRTHRPQMDEQLCNSCGTCAIYCPTGAIDMRKPVFSRIDLSYCKGCGICAKTCTRRAINMVEEGARLYASTGQNRRS